MFSAHVHLHAFFWTFQSLHSNPGHDLDMVIFLPFYDRFISSSLPSSSVNFSTTLSLVPSVALNVGNSLSSIITSILSLSHPLVASHLLLNSKFNANSEFALPLSGRKVTAISIWNLTMSQNPVPILLKRDRSRTWDCTWTNCQFWSWCCSQFSLTGLKISPHKRWVSFLTSGPPHQEEGKSLIWTKFRLNWTQPANGDLWQLT